MSMKYDEILREFAEREAKFWQRDDKFRVFSIGFGVGALFVGLMQWFHQ